MHCAKNFRWHYLPESVSGLPTNDPGPGNCGRASCSYQSAVWKCNNNASAKTLGRFNDVADGAQYVNKKCVCEVRDPYWPKFNAMSSGQAFHRDNWNVIIRRDTDYCQLTDWLWLLESSSIMFNLPLGGIPALVAFSMFPQGLGRRGKC
ncbi:Uncharacterized protein TPAR_04375 [Tolypocladium paradoxum]|uniref:Uncharacterized protein n=1 Tax=Tolypocladium paradoxum TaxID=94208 RepID=A0A2S4KZ14_9HYPO|nr:Uncharacterized protein TPAR_04375 [Tolypocladium paradoxum]